MTLQQFRRLLYSLARGLGDLQSVRRGTVHKRAARRVLGRGVGRGMGRFFP